MKLATATVLPLSHAVPVLSTQNEECRRVILYSDQLIFTATVITPILIFQLPMTYIHGRPEPTVIFDGQDSTFQAFLLCILGACYASVYSIIFRETKPKIAGFFHALAVLSMAACIAIFLWAAACSVGFKSWLLGYPLLFRG